MYWTMDTIRSEVAYRQERVARDVRRAARRPDRMDSGAPAGATHVRSAEGTATEGTITEESTEEQPVDAGESACAITPRLRTRARRKAAHRVRA